MKKEFICLPLLRSVHSIKKLYDLKKKNQPSAKINIVCDLIE